MGDIRGGGHLSKLPAGCVSAGILSAIYWTNPHPGSLREPKGTSLAEHTNLRASRRGFVGALTAATASSYNRVLGANDRVGVGFIGFGLIGKQHVFNFKNSFPDVDRVALSDVYQPRLAAGLSYLENPGAKGYGDFRKLLDDKNVDAVVLAAPDHWHAMQTVMACAAGKDVYVEKPLTVAIDESKWMLQAQAKYKRVVVVGTQRRHNPSFKKAKDIVESGVLGKIHAVKMGGSQRNIYPGFGKTAAGAPPAELDYDMWLGPAPKRPYQAHRALYHFRWFWDYSGGQMTNLGAHSIDQFQYIMSAKAPTQVVSFGGRYALEDDGETPDLQECIYAFPNFLMTFSMREANGYRDSQGTVILGTKGSLVLNGNRVVSEMKGDPINSIPRFQGHPVGGPVYNDTKPEPYIAAAEGAASGAPAGAQQRSGGGAPIGSLEDQLFVANKRDWINCIKSRAKPFCDLESGHRVAVTCHLANMSLRLGGRPIKWDPEKQQVVGDREAAAMCRKEYRAPWDRVLHSLIGV
jgi:predicted dehydrogenase